MKRIVFCSASALLLVLALRNLYQPSYRPIVSYPECVDLGEVLIHKLYRASSDNAHLPMSGILTALAFSHSTLGLGQFFKAALGMLTLALTFALGCVAGSAAQGLTGAALLVFSWYRIPAQLDWHRHDGYFHAMLSVLVLVAAGMLARRARAPGARRDAAFGAAVGASLLYRSTLAFFPVLLLLREIFRRRPSRRSLAGAALALTAAASFLLPWIAMNWQVHHEFVPFEHDEANAGIVMGALGQITKISWDWRSLYHPPIQDERLPSVVGWAVSEIARHPARYLEAIAIRLRLVFQFQPLLFAAACVGAALSRRQASNAALGGLAAYYALIHCLMAIVPHYFDPLWPVAAALGGAAASSWIGSLGAELETFCRRWSERLLDAALAGVLSLALMTAGVVIVYAASYSPDSGTYEEALNAAITASPRDAWLLYERGTRRLRAGQVDQAVADLARAEAERPGDERHEAVLAWARLLSGEPRPFLEWHERHKTMTTDQAVLAADGYLKLGRSAEARRRLKEEFARLAGEGLGRSCQGAVRSISEWLAARPLSERMSMTRVLTESLPECREAWIYQADLAIEAGDAALTRESERVLLRQDPAVREELLALCARRAGQAAHDSQTALARRYLAERERLGGTAMRVLSAVPGPPRSEGLPAAAAQEREAALLYQSMGNREEARRCIRRLLAAYPHSGVLLNDMGVLEYARGNSIAAIGFFHAAIAADPALFSAYLSLAAADSGLGRAAEARQVYDAALASGKLSAEGRRMILKARRELKK